MRMAVRRPDGRKNEAINRCRFTVRVLSVATSVGRAPTSRRCRAGELALRIEPAIVGLERAVHGAVAPSLKDGPDGVPGGQRLGAE